MGGSMKKNVEQLREERNGGRQSILQSKGDNLGPGPTRKHANHGILQLKPSSISTHGLVYHGLN